MTPGRRQSRRARSQLGRCDARKSMVEEEEEEDNPREDRFHLYPDWNEQTYSTLLF